MSRPGWMRDRDKVSPLRLRHCVNCDAGGQPCGQTNNIPGEGRLTMYRCNRHPTVRFYRHTLACEDFRPRSS